MWLLIIGIVGVVVLWYAFAKKMWGPEPGELEKYITHRYSVSENRELIVNNWDCGGPCNYHTVVYLQETKANGKIKDTTLLNCQHISDVELTDITESSARISFVDGDATGCEYKVGDIINF